MGPPPGGPDQELHCRRHPAARGGRRAAAGPRCAWGVKGWAHRDPQRCCHSRQRSRRPSPLQSKVGDFRFVASLCTLPGRARREECKAVRAPSRRLQPGKWERGPSGQFVRWRGRGDPGEWGAGAAGRGGGGPRSYVLPSWGRVGLAAGAGERCCRRLRRVLGCPWSSVRGSRLVPAPRAPRLCPEPTHCPGGPFLVPKSVTFPRLPRDPSWEKRAQWPWGLCAH